METNKSKEAEFEFHFVTGTVLILSGIRLMQWFYNLTDRFYDLLTFKISLAVSRRKLILREEESRWIFNVKSHKIKNFKRKCKQEYFSMLILKTKKDNFSG